jgi:flagellar basal body-associated protein FliL
MTEVNEVNFSKGGKMAEGEGGRGLGRLIRILVIGLVAVALLAAIAVGGWWFFLRKSPEHAAQSGAGKEGARGAETASELIEHPQYLDLGSFTVNLSEGRRYLKTSMQLLISEEKAKEFLSGRVVEIKDLVVGELQQNSADTLKDPRERELLKQRILTKLQSLLPIPPKEWKDPMPIKKLLITEFLVQ